jgi:sporulation protein YtfJ
MSEMSEIIKASLDSIKDFADSENIVGRAINTPSGVTVIPISKMTVGFAGGGLDYGAKKLSLQQNFGSGSGTGVSITPIAFLTISADASVNLIRLDVKSENTERMISLIERSPEIIDRIRSAFL